MKITHTFNLKRLLTAGITLVTLAGTCLAPSVQANPIRGEINESLFGDLHLPMYVWSKGVTDPSAIMVAIHGGCLHGRTYNALGEALSAKNVMVVSMDMRGYGKWYYEHFGDETQRSFHYRQTKKDFAAIVGRLRDAYPGVPIYFIGESLGANLSLHMIGEQKHLADGAILCSTYAYPKLFFQPYMVVSFLQFLRKPLSKVSLVPYIKTRLSDTADFARQHLADPLGRDYQSAKEMWQSMRINHRGKFFAKQIPTDTAVLMIHGECDKLCAPNSSMRLFEKIPAQDKTFALIPKRGHLLVETPEIRPEVLQVLENWLETHAKGPQYHHALSGPQKAEPHKLGHIESVTEEVSLN